MQLRFEDRREAGEFLAEQLTEYADRSDVLVLALPRGGVPVGYEVARKLHAPLDVFTVRKLGYPGNEEYAMGAIATGGVRVLNQDAIDDLNLTEEDVKRTVEEAEQELERREHIYRADRTMPTIKGRTVLLVDDGMATGSSMAAAVKALKQYEPGQIIVAVPAASAITCKQFEDDVNSVICAITPEPFMSVGVWYENFEQMQDEEVRELLDSARAFIA